MTRPPFQRLSEEIPGEAGINSHNSEKRKPEGMLWIGWNSFWIL